MTKAFESLDQIFNVAEPISQNNPIVTIDVPSVPAVVEKKDEQDDQLADYQKTRETLNRILLKTETALDDMMECARQSEKSRDFEVVGQLAKTLAEVSDRILDVHNKMNQIRKKQDTKAEANAPTKIEQQNNVVFTGNPSDLIDLLRNKK